MNILLWVLQVLAAFVYGASGVLTIESFVFVGVSELCPEIITEFALPALR